MALYCIEGCDGAGKATQSKLLADALPNALLLSFPRYDTPVGKVIRGWLKGDVALRETQTSLAGLGEHTEHVVHPSDALMFRALMAVDKLEAYAQFKSFYEVDRPIVCDRWVPSAICYGQADGLDLSWLQHINATLPEPDVSIFLDVPPEEALRRRPEMRDRNERDRKKQAVVRENYLAMWRRLDGTSMNRYVVVDGMGTVEEVHQRVRAACWL